MSCDCQDGFKLPVKIEHQFMCCPLCGDPNGVYIEKSFIAPNGDTMLLGYCEQHENGKFEICIHNHKGWVVVEAREI